MHKNVNAVTHYYELIKFNSNNTNKLCVNYSSIIRMC